MTDFASSPRRGRVVAAAFAALAAAALGGPAAAAAPAAGRDCFYMSDWRNWSAPQPDVLYLAVRGRDVFRIDLSHGSGLLTSPGVHLVSETTGGGRVCAPIDLTLRVSDGHGMSIPLFVSAITKLTPDQVAALPKADRP